VFTHGFLFFSIVTISIFSCNYHNLCLYFLSFWIMKNIAHSKWKMEKICHLTWLWIYLDGIFKIRTFICIHIIWFEVLCKFNVLRRLKLKGWEGYTHMLIFEIIVEISKHCTLEQFGCFNPFGKSCTKNYHVNCWLLIYLNKHVRI
jgi:hypothetical protein